MAYKVSTSEESEIFPITSPSQRGSVRRAWRAWGQMISDLRQDIDRYTYMGSSNWLVALLGYQGLWVLTQYRVSRWVHFHLHVPILRFLFKLVCAIWQKLIEMVTGVELPNRAEVGPGIYIPHANGIIIHIDAKIGRNCNISQQVTIGVGGRGDQMGTPVIGERVFLGPGAKVFGPIVVGNDVAIGANSVAIRDLPDQAVAVGSPAKVISHKGSADFVLYRGCQAHQPS